MGFIYKEIYIRRSAQAAVLAPRVRACKIWPRRVSSSDFAKSETIALDLFSKRLGPSPHMTTAALDLSLQVGGAVLLASPKKASKCSRGARAQSTKGARVEAEVADDNDVLARRHS